MQIVKQEEPGPGGHSEWMDSRPGLRDKHVPAVRKHKGGDATVLVRVRLEPRDTDGAPTAAQAAPSGRLRARAAAQITLDAHECFVAIGIVQDGAPLAIAFVAKRSSAGRCAGDSLVARVSHKQSALSSTHSQPEDAARTMAIQLSDAHR